MMMIATFTGSNHFALKSELDSRMQAFVAAEGELGLERIDGEEADLQRITEAMQSLPFLASKKMVVLKNPSANKQFAEKVDMLLGTVPDTTDLIIIESKLDKRLSYYKTLKSKTAFREFGELDARELSNWLVQQTKLQGGSLQSADALYLVERVGTSQELLFHELEKLLSYSPNITGKRLIC